MGRGERREEAAEQYQQWKKTEVGVIYLSPIFSHFCSGIRVVCSSGVFMPPLLFFGTSCRYGRLRAFFKMRLSLPRPPVWSYWRGMLGGQGRPGGKGESRALCFESSRRT